MPEEYWYITANLVAPDNVSTLRVVLVEKDGKLTMFPWDYNLSFGAYQHNLEEVYKEIEGVNEATRMINLPILNPIKEN